MKSRQIWSSFTAIFLLCAVAVIPGLRVVDDEERVAAVVRRVDDSRGPGHVRLHQPQRVRAARVVQEVDGAEGAAGNPEDIRGDRNKVVPSGGLCINRGLCTGLCYL